MENRARLTFEVMDAIISVFGVGRVGIRLSPHVGKGPNDARDSDPERIYSHLVRQLSARYGRALSYLHLIETTRSFGSDTTWARPGDSFQIIEKYRPLFDGTVIAASGFTPAAAEEKVAAGLADAVAFGRLFISTPDLPDRIRAGAMPNKYDRPTFYVRGGTEGKSLAALEQGCTSYPTLSDASPDQLLDFDEMMKQATLKAKL